MRRTSRKNQRGFVSVAYALMLVTMIGFTGLAVDVGFMQFEKRKVQMAADAGAMGALREMERGNTDLVAAGQNDAALNGFTNNGTDTWVTVSNPPATGPYASPTDTNAVQVTVTHHLPLFFMQIFGQQQASVSATSTARTSSTEGSIGGCIFAMDPTASGSLTVSGNFTITTACSAVVNSSSTTAFSMGGNSTWNLVNGAAIGVYGGYNLFGSEVLNETTQGEQAVQQLAAPVADPLAGVSAPTPTGMSVVYVSGGFSDNPNSTTTLNPGVYCGGMKIHGTVTFNPGIYVIAGGGMTINGKANITSSTSTGAGGETGVMFYNTSSGSQSWGCSGASTSDAAGWTIDGGAGINLTGLSTTTPVGVLFFEDRNLSGLNYKINGGSTTTYDGALYFLNSNLTFNGNNKTPGFLYMVADTITFTGNAGANNTANLGNDKSSLANVFTLAPSSTGGGLVQ